MQGQTDMAFRSSAIPLVLCPLVNSLDMKFAPVPGTQVLFCIHPTRKSDYRKYADANPGVNMAWVDVRSSGKPVSYAEDHPVVMVSWIDSEAFCTWLSKKESLTYRLSTDHEWSVAGVIAPAE